MSGINDKLINYEGLSTFYDDLKQNDLAAKQDVLSAGDNISIQNGAISAKGYKFDDEPKEELKLIDDILHAAGMPAGQSLGLKVSGAAGATTYTWSDTMGGMFAQLIQYGMLPGAGATYQTANGKSGVIVAVDASTITFEETLDADNALTDESVPYVVDTYVLDSTIEGVTWSIKSDTSIMGVELTGAADATTYTYSGIGEAIATVCLKKGYIIEVSGGRSATIVSVDYQNETITLNETLDATNALSDEDILYITGFHIASGKQSHVEGGAHSAAGFNFNEASNEAAHAEGAGTKASGAAAHAEGAQTVASNMCAHAEGNGTKASGRGSHAEGNNSEASGDCSHAEGGSINGVVYKTEASGSSSHAEGMGTTASGDASHAEGTGTAANNAGEHAEGLYNVSHTTSGNDGSAKTQHSIGVGLYNARKNAVEVMQNGDMYVLGVGGYQGTDTKVQDATIKTLQEYITALETRIYALEHPQTAE